MKAYGLMYDDGERRGLVIGASDVSDSIVSIVPNKDGIYIAGLAFVSQEYAEKYYNNAQDNKHLRVVKLEYSNSVFRGVEG